MIKDILQGDHCAFIIISRSFLLVRKMSQTKVLEEIKTHIVCSIPSFFNRAVCEIKCNNVVQPDRPYMTKRSMRIACWIPKAANTNSE